jgi:hypothetical protein
MQLQQQQDRLAPRVTILGVTAVGPFVIRRTPDG